MPPPRANFECESCAEHYELPVAATLCPVCGNGVTRLFDAVNVSGDVTRKVDKMARPYLEQGQSVAALREGRPASIDPRSAMGAIPADGRSASRAHNVPALQEAKALGGPTPRFVNRE